jgi:hypothetical protein
MMPESDSRNPFEDHIESDAFDVSQLSIPGDPARLQEQLNTLLNSLPQPLDYRLWDEELDDTQKQLCIHLATAVIERYIRPGHADELGDISDDDLLMILNVPLAMAMIVQQRLHVPQYQYVPADHALRPERPPETLPERPMIHTPRTLPQRIQHFLGGIRESVRRVFKRAQRRGKV